MRVFLIFFWNAVVFNLSEIEGKDLIGEVIFCILFIFNLMIQALVEERILTKGADLSYFQVPEKLQCSSDVKVSSIELDLP